MFYLDTCIGLSRSVQFKTYVASGNDRIIRITGGSSVADTDATAILNQEAVIFFSMYSELLGKDAWTCIILPYWLYNSEGAGGGGGGSNIEVVSTLDEALNGDLGVLYIVQ